MHTLSEETPSEPTEAPFVVLAEDSSAGQTSTPKPVSRKRFWTSRQSTSVPHTPNDAPKHYGSRIDSTSRAQPTQKRSHVSPSMAVDIPLSRLPVGNLGPNPWSDSPSSSYPETLQSGHSITRSPTSSLQSSSTVFLVSPQNNYAGFCKGAYLLQYGKSEGLKRRNQSTGMTGEGWYMACCSSKCAFQGAARQVGRQWLCDNSSFVAHGVICTWLFLAKSHVTQSSIKRGVGHFRCIFCVLLGESSPIYDGRSALLKHVSGHAGASVATTLLEGPLTVSDCGVTPAQQFDINFLSDNASEVPRESIFIPDSASTIATLNSRDSIQSRDTYADSVFDGWKDD